MTTQNANHRDLLISAITLYLRNHPNAADSLDGIMQWWLPQQKNTVDENDLQQALDYLVAANMISRSILLDGHIIYSSKEDDAQAK
jgi:hypothetical protein